MSEHVESRVGKPWVATDEDCETGYLIEAPEGLSEDQAIAMFCDLGERDWGKIKSVDGDPLDAELRPFREPREGDALYGDAVLVPCGPYERDQATEQVWVIEGIEIGF